MKFVMNGYHWLIKEVKQEEFYEHRERDFSRQYYGKCWLTKQEIWLDKDLPKEVKIKTLYHELMHCYIANFITINTLDNTTEEIWCDISASSHDIIHKIVKDYFKEE